MPTPATCDDAHLILRLYELRREEKLRHAREWFARHFHVSSFEEAMDKFPPDSDESRYFRMVTSYWEMVASFLTSGALNQELFFQSGREMLLVWERVRVVVPSIRQAFHDDSQLQNLEKAAQAFAAYLNQQAPDSYEAFAARMKPRT